MIYVAMAIFAIPFLYIMAKLSKPACALGGLLGVIIAWASFTAGYFPGVGFGVGLLGFCILIFVACNGGRW